jgi:hypothetical protein
MIGGGLLLLVTFLATLGHAQMRFGIGFHIDSIRMGLQRVFA